jgi:hypothetical protein
LVTSIRHYDVSLETCGIFAIYLAEGCNHEL